MAIGIEHLPEDPKVLQKMVLDLTGQLDRESAERHKVETILRELIEARRSRKSEELSVRSTGTVRSRVGCPPETGKR